MTAATDPTRNGEGDHPQDGGGAGEIAAGKPAPFAKLFENAEGQVLILLGENEDEEPTLTLRTNTVNGMTVERTETYSSESAQRRAFYRIDESLATEEGARLRNFARKFGKDTQ